jgi:hypothetical protein
MPAKLVAGGDVGCGNEHKYGVEPVVPYPRNADLKSDFFITELRRKSTAISGGS